MDPATLAAGPVLVVAPHFDDEVLGCGGTLALLPDRSRVRIAYATDGRSSLRRRAADPGETDIGEIRKQESLAALAVLGIRPDQCRFANLPEGRLTRHKSAYRSFLEDALRAVEPAVVFAPFRYDKHREHVLTNALVRDLRKKRKLTFRLLEYFVYFQWKLLPDPDIRNLIRPECLLRADIRTVSARKREALDCFVSQTTPFRAGQRRAVLSAKLLDAFCLAPETFLDAVPDLTDRQFLTVPPVCLRIIHAMEPVLKDAKERLLDLVDNQQQTT